MLPSFGSLSVVPWILFAQMSWTLDAVSVHNAARTSSGSRLEIRDRAGLFGRGAGRRAGEALGRIRRMNRVPVVIETVASLDGARADDVARQRARSAGSEHLCILLSADDREVGVIAARRGPASRLSDEQREAIRRAFLGPLRVGDADQALEQGVRAIGLTLAAPGPRRGIGESLVPASLLLAALALLISPPFRGWRRRRRRRSSPGAAPMVSMPLPRQAETARSWGGLPE